MRTYQLSNSALYLVRDLLRREIFQRETAIALHNSGKKPCAPGVATILRLDLSAYKEALSELVRS